MFRILLLFIFSFPLFVSAQTWTEKRDEFYAYLQKSDFASAVIVGEEVLLMIEKDSAYADIEFYVANTYAALKDFDKAIFHAQSEANIRAKTQGKTNGYYLNSVYYLASYYSTIENYVAAVPLYMEVYVEMKKQYPGMDNTINMAISLAEICHYSGITKLAQELYEDSWEWIRSSRSPEDSVYINMSYTLGDFYIQNGMPEKSIPFFIMERDRQEKVYGKKSEQYMTAYNALGEMYIMSGIYDKAKEVYTDFLLLSENYYGKKSADYATALNNLAVTYEKNAEFAEAEKLYLKSLAIKEKVYKKESDYYALTLSNLGVIYDEMGNYQKAEEVLDEAISIYEKVYSGDNANYATALNNIASIYSSSGKYEKAIEVIGRSLEMNKKISGEASTGYLIALNSLASIYQSKNDYDAAEKYYLEALPLYEKVLGKTHTDYGTVLFNLSNVNFAKGKYKTALEYIELAIPVHEASVGKIHDNYAKSIQTKASILVELGQTRKADELFSEAGEILSVLFGKLHPNYAIFLNNYGYFLFVKGDYHSSQKVLTEALKIQNDALGKNHPNNISLLSNIGNLEIQRQNFKVAEENLLQALAIAKANYTPDQSEYSNVQNNLATLYFELGNYEKAEPYYLEAMEGHKKFYGENHTEYATSLNNLGTLYLSKAGATNEVKTLLELSDKAISYFKKAITIDSLFYGTENPDLTSHLNNLAEAYRLRGQNVESEKLFLRSIELAEKHFGVGNSKSAVNYHNLGLLYAGMGQFEKAEETVLKSISIFEENYGKNTPAANNAKLGLAYIYEATNRMEKAKEQYLHVLATERKILEQNFSFLSESEKESYVQSITTKNYMFNTFALKSKSSDPSVTGAVYDNEIYNKGLLFRSSSRVKDIIAESGDEALQSVYSEWMDVRQELSVLYSTPEAERSKNIHEVEEKANSLEKELILKSENIKNALNLSQANWSDIKNKLKPGQAALEFIHFLRNDTLREDLYCALIITFKSSKPEMIELFTANQLNEIIGKNSGTTYESVSSLYGKQKSLNVNLFSLVWGPLEKSLTGITEIYYSPTGLLHKISISSLGDLNGKYVSDKYILHQLNSTASLVDMAAGKMEPSKSMMTMIGGVQYDTDNSLQHVWSYLPGTLTETEHIHSSLTKAGMKTELFTGELASEENLKKMDGEKSPDILHVATHGFFFGDPNVQKEKIEKQVTAVKFRGESRGVNTLVENPNALMRSGIVLAGANDVWNETKPGIKNEKEDGILTAYEVSLMNFQNTKLVVLSACETGLGDIKGSEGVYGLQRAFRMAGVDMLIMSLWQVPDEETDEFMTSFYNEMIKTKEIRKAFVNAQKLMRAKYDPYFWGAFVLIE